MALEAALYQGDGATSSHPIRQMHVTTPDLVVLEDVYYETSSCKAFLQECDLKKYEVIYLLSFDCQS